MGASARKQLFCKLRLCVGWCGLQMCCFVRWQFFFIFCLYVANCPLCRFSTLAPNGLALGEVFLCCACGRKILLSACYLLPFFYFKYISSLTYVLLSQKQCFVYSFAFVNLSFVGKLYVSDAFSACGLT